MKVMGTKQQFLLIGRKGRRRKRKGKVFLLYVIVAFWPLKSGNSDSIFIFASYIYVSVSYKSVGHVHEIHGHKTTLSEHNEEHKERKAESKGIYFMKYVDVAIVLFWAQFQLAGLGSWKLNSGNCACFSPPHVWGIWVSWTQNNNNLTWTWGGDA